MIVGVGSRLESGVRVGGGVQVLLEGGSNYVKSSIR
jgi:hypothetical protein